MKWLVLIVMLACGTAFADNAADLAKRGIDEFKAGKYADAAATLANAYQLDQKPETLFALAQAERLNGDCTSAVEHYRKVLDRVTDMNVGKLVAEALELCKKDEPPPQPKPEPIVVAPPAPTVITKTVVREVPRTDNVSMTLFAVGALALGGSVGLFVAADANSTAAQRAYTQGDYNTFESRFDVERDLSFVALGVGVAAIGVATWRLLGHEQPSADVAVMPTTHGGGVAFSATW